MDRSRKGNQNEKEEDDEIFKSAFSSSDDEVIDVEEPRRTQKNVPPPGSNQVSNGGEEECAHGNVVEVSASGTSVWSDVEAHTSMLRTEGSSARTRKADEEAPQAVPPNQGTNQANAVEEEIEADSDASTAVLKNDDAVVSSKQPPQNSERSKSVMKIPDIPKAAANSQVARKRTGGHLHRKTKKGKDSKQKVISSRNEMRSHDVDSSSVYTPPPSPAQCGDSTSSKPETTKSTTEIAQQKKKRPPIKNVLTIEQLQTAIADVGRISSTTTMVHQQQVGQPPSSREIEANAIEAEDHSSQSVPASQSNAVDRASSSRTAVAAEPEPGPSHGIRMSFEQSVNERRNIAAREAMYDQMEAAKRKKSRQRIRSLEIDNDEMPVTNGNEERKGNEDDDYENQRQRGPRNRLSRRRRRVSSQNNDEGDQGRNKEQKRQQLSKEKGEKDQNRSRQLPRYVFEGIPENQIAQIQRDTENEIPPLFFQRLLREVMRQFPDENGNTYRIEVAAIVRLRTAVQARMIEMFEDANLLSNHAGRVTLMQKDMDVLRQLNHDEPFFEQVNDPLERKSSSSERDSSPERTPKKKFQRKDHPPKK